MNADRFETIREDEEAELLHTITPHDLETFVQLTGDDNPIHVDETFAATTTFRKPIVHGMLTASFISTMIGTKLPGLGSVWYEQSLRFLSPVRVGEKIRVWAKVRHKSPAQRILTLETHVFGEDGRKVIEGEAKVKMLKPEIPEKSKNPVSPAEERGAVVISGAGRGIGAAIARELAAAGHGVVVNYRQSAAEAQAVVDEIIAAGGRAVAVQVDVSRRREVDRMADLAVREFGYLDGLVNNASPGIDHKAFAEIQWTDIQAQIDVQIQGAFNLCQAVLPALLERGGGSIVNIGSILADDVPPEKVLPYVLTKAALASFSRSLAVETGPKGVRVNLVSPGMTSTDLIADLPEKAKMVQKARTPLRRLATPEDIAGVVAFLFSEKARHITGENLRVCGGSVML